MIVLFDYDSLVYGCVHYIASTPDLKAKKDPVYPNSFRIRKWFNEGRTREWMETEIVNLSINRLSQMGDKIFFEIEETGIDITGIEYFLTAAKKSIRKGLYQDYKGNRVPNKWVNLVRKELLNMKFASTSPIWEADDLIADRVEDLGSGNCVICSIDKDLKTMAGVHFDYYRPRLRDEEGNPVLDENGFRKVSPCRGLQVVDEVEGKLFYYKQLLMGDSGDNIKGIPGIGKVKAEKILSGWKVEECEDIVKSEYIKKFGESGEFQFELHKILIGLGTRNRNLKFFALENWGADV